MSDTLFDDTPFRAIPDEPGVSQPSAGRRRTQRQYADLAAGRHPLTRGRLRPQAAGAADRAAQGRRCGNCQFRRLLEYRRRDWPKCVRGDGVYLTHGAATDCRAWWPACQFHEWGDSKLSPGGARYVPEDVERAVRAQLAGAVTA